MDWNPEPGSAQSETILKENFYKEQQIYTLLS